MHYTPDVGEFFRQNHEELNKMAYAICSHYQAPIHDLIITDLYIRLIEGDVLSRFDPSQAKISTYLFPIIRNLVLGHLLRNEYRVGQKKYTPEYHEDSLIRMADYDGIEYVIHASIDHKVHMEFILQQDRNYNTDGIDGLRSELEDFEGYLERKNKRFNLNRRKKPEVHTEGCSLLEVYQHFKDGLNNKEIAEIYGTSDMWISNLKNRIRALMVRYGFKFKVKKRRRGRKRYGRTQVPKM